MTFRSASVSVPFAACTASSFARTIWFDMASTALSANESCVVIASMLRMNCWLLSMLRCKSATRLDPRGSSDGSRMRLPEAICASSCASVDCSEPMRLICDWKDWKVPTRMLRFLGKA